MREAFRHRIAVAWVDAVVRGGVHCISLYLKDSEGLSATNEAILEELFAVIKQLTGPWIIGGDFNMDPQTLVGSKWVDMVGGTIFASALPTCHSSTYDYFIVHKGIAGAVAGVQRIEDSATHPHRFTTLLIRGDARRYAVRRLIKAPKVQGELPRGPPAVAPVRLLYCPQGDRWGRGGGAAHRR